MGQAYGLDILRALLPQIFFLYSVKEGSFYYSPSSYSKDGGLVEGGGSGTTKERVM